MCGRGMNDAAVNSDIGMGGRGMSDFGQDGDQFKKLMLDKASEAHIWSEETVLRLESASTMGQKQALRGVIMKSNMERTIMKVAI